MPDPRAVKALFTLIAKAVGKGGDEFISRYEALGMPWPDPETVCGECQGTAWVPVPEDDMEEPFRTLWLAAEAKEHADDGWHFVMCPVCGGTGKRKPS